MTVVLWRPARHSDRAALSVFECADPPKPIKNASTGWQLDHPRMWEYHAQSMIRDLARRVPARPPVRVFVGEDDDGLAAVVSWREVAGPAEVHLDVIGVASRWRRRGGRCAREIARAALREIEAAAIEAGAEELYLEGEIYSENDASQRLAMSFDFECLFAYQSGAETWSIKVPIAGAIFEDDDEM